MLVGKHIYRSFPRTAQTIQQRCIKSIQRFVFMNRMDFFIFRNGHHKPFACGVEQIKSTDLALRAEEIFHIRVSCFGLRVWLGNLLVMSALFYSEKTAKMKIRLQFSEPETRNPKPVSLPAIFLPLLPMSCLSANVLAALLSVPYN